MKIGADMDGVIVDFMHGFLDFYNKKTNSNILFKDCVSYNFWDIIGGTKQQAIGLVDEFYNSDMFNELGLINSAKESLEKLSKENNLCIITSRPIRFKPKTEAFLGKYFSEISLNVFYSDDFHRQGNISKAGICKQRKVEVFIEDNLDYATSCSEKGVRTFLLNKPWNQGCCNGVIRVNNWKEILKRIEEIRK